MEMRLEKNNCNLLRKTRNFYSVTPRLQLSDLDYVLKLKWGGGGILKLSELDSLSNFTLGGGILKLSWRIGVFCRIWTKFSTTPAGSCITDSLSHTTYVETNQKKLKNYYFLEKKHCRRRNLAECVT